MQYISAVNNSRILSFWSINDVAESSWHSSSYMSQDAFTQHVVPCVYAVPHSLADTCVSAERPQVSADVRIHVIYTVCGTVQLCVDYCGLRTLAAKCVRTTAEMSDIIASCGLSGQSYADDTQAYISAPAIDEQEASSRLAECVERLNQWMGQNRLKQCQEDPVDLASHTAAAGQADYQTAKTHQRWHCTLSSDNWRLMCSTSDVLRRTEGTFTTARRCCAVFVILAPDTKLQTYLLTHSLKKCSISADCSLQRIMWTQHDFTCVGALSKRPLMSSTPDHSVTTLQNCSRVAGTACQTSNQSGLVSHSYLFCYAPRFTRRTV